MHNILDRFVLPATSFQPKTLSEFFASHLARKLNDAAAIRHYVSLADNHSEGQLLCAYRRAKRTEGNVDLARRFNLELERTHLGDYHDSHFDQISIRIERRTVSAAIFQNGHLEYSDARQLSSSRNKAEASAIGFVDWLLERFPVHFATLEAIPNGQDIQRRVLHDSVCAILRDRALSIWEVPRQELLDACGHPPLKSRAQLREVATAIWPILAGTHAKLFIQDAAILGLHVQTERLFIIN
jgi:hypothetical protein